MDKYEYAILHNEQWIVISPHNEEVAKVLADNFAKSDKVEVFRRPVGDWVDYHGDE